MTSLVRWLTVHTGIHSVRLTGGEPLVRVGVYRLIAQLSSLPGVREVTLTTNGTLLSRTAWSLKAAGLSRVNVSLDSMDEQRFAEITRGGNLQRTLAGVAMAQQAGLAPIKLNSVLQRSTWRIEVPRLLDYAAENRLEIRFIELMRTGTERTWCESECVSVDEVSRELRLETIVTDTRTRRPAQKTLVKWRGTVVEVGWITPRSNPFCSGCDRLRMDTSGRIRRCLMDPATLDLPELLRLKDESDAVLEFEDYLNGKVRPYSMDTSFAMSQIGG